jgi:hypothetical protein
MKKNGFTFANIETFVTKSIAYQSKNNAEVAKNTAW